MTTATDTETPIDERVKFASGAAATAEGQPPESRNDSGESGAWHVVEQGETLLHIAQQNGVTWQAIWKHRNNRRLRDQRLHPHILAPGDRVFIPAPTPKQVSLATGVRKFVRTRPSAVLRVRIEDADGEPLTYQRYRLRAGDVELRGTTDARGILALELPADAELGELRLEDTPAERLDFLQPIVLAPQVGDECNTVRAYFRTPLDPDFTARLRLDATRLLIACRELLGADATEPSGDADAVMPLAPYVATHARRLRAAAAAELGAARAAAPDDGAADTAPDSSDDVSTRLSALSRLARKQAEKALREANGDSVRRRADQDSERFEQQVAESLNDLLKGHQTGFAKSGARPRGTGGREGVERLARQAAKEAAERNDRRPEDAAKAARAYLVDMLDRNVESAGRRLRRDLTHVERELSEQAIYSANDVGAGEATVATLAARYATIVREALDILVADAKRIGRRHELPTDGVIDVLLAEGRRLIRESGEHARMLIPDHEPTTILRNDASELVGADAAARSIDDEVNTAYTRLRARELIAPEFSTADETTADDPVYQARAIAVRKGSAKDVELRKAVAKRIHATPESTRDSAPPEHESGTPEADAKAGDDRAYAPLMSPASGAHAGPFERIPIRIGHLDPINTISGVIGRLNNLGYDAGPPDVYMGPYARHAMREFQFVEGLPVDGEIDAATLGRLLDRHGC